MDFAQIESRIKYNFKDKSLLKRALTLASADGADNNQTLEFFGDAILEFIVSEKIYDENESEGSLTERRKALVSDGALAPISRKLGLDKHLIRGASDTRNKKAVPSAYEAVVAAIYLDGGMDCAKRFVISTLDFTAHTVENFKGELQEYLQSRGETRPVYENKNVGNEHCPRHMVKLRLYGRTFEGVAEKVKDAEQQAARSALSFIKSKK